MITTILTVISRAVVGLAYALAPKDSQLKLDLRPIWRPGAQ